MGSKYIIAIFLLVQLIYSTKVCADFYTSVSSLEEILYTEILLSTEYEEYIINVRKNNEKIKNFLEEVEKSYVEISKNPNEFYTNPLKTFKLLKRFVMTWKKIENIVNNDRPLQLLQNNMTKIEKEQNAKPAEADLIGAAKGLVRLQNTYNLNALDISEGVLLNKEFESKLTAHDCFHIGRILYEEQNYKYASEWLIRARTLLRYELEVAGLQNQIKNAEIPFLNDTIILAYLSPALYNIGNLKMAMIFNEELLAQEPDHVHGLNNKILYDAKVIEQRQSRAKHEHPESVLPKMPEKSLTQDLYESVCRGSVYQTPKEQRNLRCRYTTRDVPFCLIAPFKMEELSHDPFVAVYYDAIYDNEMKQIIETAEDTIARSTVGNFTLTELRTSQNSWLYFHRHPFLNHVHQRLADITGLSLKTAEPLQVANYGIGGHYAPHYDFTEIPDIKHPGIGNRILTALFYINEVELGGATAFPLLRIAVQPIRGSLLVWFNMHESLELDYRTRHAACPVLKGSKWVCNEWFHQVGQEFIRPCSLEQKGEISIPYKTMYQ